MTTGNEAEVVAFEHMGVVAVQKKYELLSAVHGALDNIEINSRKRFTEMMESIFNEFGAGVSDRKLADDTGYAITSVRRWISGKTAPHKSAWSGIRTWCLDELASEMVKLQSKLERLKHDEQVVIATG